MKENHFLLFDEDGNGLSVFKMYKKMEFLRKCTCVVFVFSCFSGFCVCEFCVSLKLYIFVDSL